MKLYNVFRALISICKKSIFCLNYEELFRTSGVGNRAEELLNETLTHIADALSLIPCEAQTRGFYEKYKYKNMNGSSTALSHSVSYLFLNHANRINYIN